MGSRRARYRGPDNRQRRDGRWQHVYGALDLGTNNCRLLVAKPNRSGFRVVDAFSRIVRLGEGLGTANSLSDTAMDRTIEALQVCRAKIERNGVTRLRAVRSSWSESRVHSCCRLFRRLATPCPGSTSASPCTCSSPSTLA